MAEKKIKILLWGLIFGFLAVFTPTCFAKEVGLNKITPIKLNSISVDTTSGQTQLRFGVEIKKPSNSVPTLDIKKSVQKSLEYFFLGLVLPDEKFWVNLNPKEPHKIIDSFLADTDLGRTMLYADLKLKEETSYLMDPQTSGVGKEYWSRLYQKASDFATDKIPVITRFWIVPDEVVVNESENQLLIIKSKLKVCLEEINSSEYTEPKDRREKQLQDYALKLMEELILPSLNKSVNESHSYAGLREVYQALILARWYKNKIGWQYPLQNISYNITKDLVSDFPFQSERIYRDYINSFKKGQYSFTSGSGFYSAMTIIQYFIGGVDFRKISLAPVKPDINLIKTDSGATFTVSIPGNFENLQRPLTIVKNIELTPAIQSPKIPDVKVALVEKLNLPPIGPMEVPKRIEQNSHALRGNRDIDIIAVLSKL